MNLRDAIRSNDIEAVRKILDAGVKNINDQDNFGSTSLMLAVECEHTEIVQMLIDAGASLDIQDRYDHTALICATVQGHTKIVQMLINAGADISLKNNNGETALDWAIRRKHNNIVSLIKNRIKTRSEQQGCVFDLNL